MPKRSLADSEVESQPASLLQALEQYHSDINLKLSQFEDSLYKDKFYQKKTYTGSVSFHLPKFPM